MGSEVEREGGREGKSPMLKRKSVSIGCQKPTLPPSLTLHSTHSNPPLSIKPKGGDHLHHYHRQHQTGLSPESGKEGREGALPR